METKMIRAAIAVICVAAALPSWADADGKTLTWNGADGASWTTGENWLDGETPSAWVDGANTVFPSAATVTLDGAVTVSNLTTSGALTITGTVHSAYSGWLSTTSVLVFPGLTLDDLDGQPLSAEVHGTYAEGNNYAKEYHFVRNGSTATVQFQKAFNGHLRCIKVIFTNGADGVYARVDINNSYYVHRDNSGATYLGQDIDSITPSSLVQKTLLQTSANGAGVGIHDIRYYSARVCLTGEATFGGAVTSKTTTVEVVSPIAQTWTQPVVCTEGQIRVKGLSAVATETKYGLTGDESGDAAAWLTQDENNHVFTNMMLSRTVPVVATLRGGHIGISEDLTQSLPYHVKFDGQTMTIQFQFFQPNYIKGVLVQLRQDGANVKAKWVKSYYHNNIPIDNLGEDMETAAGVTKNNSNVTKYGVKNMTLRTVSVPSLTFSGAGSDIAEVVADNAQVVFANASARPKIRLAAHNEAEVLYTGGDGTGSGSVRMFDSGSLFMPIANMTSESRARYVFDGATLSSPTIHDTQKDGRNYINYLVLKNGATTEGNPLRCGFGGYAGMTMTYRSEGTGTNVISSGIALVNCHKKVDNAWVPDLANPNTLVLDVATDLEIPSVVRNYIQSEYYGTLVVKRGAAKLTLSGNNTFDGRFTIEEGTVEIGSNSALPASAPLTLAGGTVTCGSTTNTTGVLTLSGDAAINLEEGSLAFADSSGVLWTPGATLAITGDDKLPTRSLRFGSSESGLTTAQLRQITYNGERVSLDSSGYLRHRRGFMLIVK